MNIQTEKNQLPKKRMSNRTLGAAAAAVAFALIATPFLGSTAEATLDTGKFCIQAVNAEDATITGKGGAKDCGEAVAGPEAPVEIEQILVRQATTIVINFQKSRWKAQPWTVGVYADGVQVASDHGTTTATGYMAPVVKWDREMPMGTSYEVEELRYDLTIGSDQFSWAVPVSVFEEDARLPEIDEETGEVIKPWLGGEVNAGYYGGMILFDIDGVWKLPAGITAG